MSEPARVRVDLRRGGRWTSLRVAGREWLWRRRDDPLRDRAAPGDPFADAGGIEECVPTVRGTPDHGDACCRDAVVRDSGDSPRLRLTAGACLPTSVALWRNLRGFPASGPYRSIGVEPMLGSVFDLAEARDDADAVTVPATGRVEWELEIAEAA
jgi:hypothetical protein